MAVRPSAKKSETVEFRLSHADKTAFVALCRAEGLTASEAIRRAIEARLRRPAERARFWRRMALAAVVGLALGAGAVPALAQALSPSRAAFERLDRDHDGLLTFEEFRLR
ncbi:MAG: hypothetical protein K5831_00875 [Brevundimonas sp.]|jgi:hypothetical protein|uniref:EF-hand domain-containing protein n=1 Tax=Brevundimonas sp. TaxID=1871086 RepID=UPI00258818A1|nr:EF-hand domain-containing protein [Brevundimonas sp.]MCV0413421.1 hypothetical protein [Brevundimonas sp.]